MTQKTDEWMPKADDRGHFNIKIQMDGTWTHEGDPIKRDKLVKLFASVLHRDEDGQHWLVTPVEKGRIDVEVAPLFITGIDIGNQGEPSSQSIHISTSTGDACTLGAEHPLSMTPAPDGELLPTVVIRDGLAGLFNRATYYDLMDLITEGPAPNHRLGIWSQGVFFELEADLG